MVCELRYIPSKLDKEIANAMAVAIAMSSPITHCDFRDAQTIMLDLTSEVYGPVRRGGKSSRLSKLFKVPALLHLQLGFSLPRLRVHVSRTYSVLFLQSRKTSDFYCYMSQRYNAYKMKVLGDNTNIGQERIEVISTCIQNFLAEERSIIAIEMNSNNVMKRTANGSLQGMSTSVPSTEGVLNATLLTDPNDSVLINTVENKKLLKKRKRYSFKEITLSYALKK
jgi:hypothetical protein